VRASRHQAVSASPETISVTHHCARSTLRRVNKNFDLCASLTVSIAHGVIQRAVSSPLLSTSRPSPSGGYSQNERCTNGHYRSRSDWRLRSTHRKVRRWKRWKSTSMFEYMQMNLVRAGDIQPISARGKMRRRASRLLELSSDEEARVQVAQQRVGSSSWCGPREDLEHDEETEEQSTMSNLFHDISAKGADKVLQVAFDRIQ